MSIDLSQFHQVFFEESLEGLEILESGLLGLAQGKGTTDLEAINTIFRAAHSIKGGSGTFGFKSVSDFTHIMETLLDEMRDGKRPVTEEAADVLLQAVDCLRHMLTTLQAGQQPDGERVAQYQAMLQQLLDGNSSSAQAAATAANATESAPAGWHIVFCPHRDMLKTGNDPTRILRALGKLGELEVEVDSGWLPPFDDMDPTECYLAWNIYLRGNVKRADIDEIFEWVEDSCDMAISPLRDDSNAAGEQPQVTESVARVEGVSATAPVTELKPAARPASPAAAAGPVGDSEAKAAAANASIRVDTQKIDQLINMVGELVITQSMLSLLGENFSMDRLGQLHAGLTQLERHMRELQETVLKIRMLPISFCFNRFPRVVRDLSAKLGKQIELKLSGEHTELDKTVLEKITDPLVHLVRNALDHGIESPATRRAAGKPETGTIHLSACHAGGNIVIEIADDGAGLNTEKILNKARERGIVGPDENLPEERIYDLIFAPGFSTADQISDVSGRGVGMDVVRRNIKELGGTIEIRSVRGQGSTFIVRLPLTLAILDGQLVRVGDQTYVIPLVSIVESLQIKRAQVNSVAGRMEVYRLREHYIPIARLYRLFNIQPDSTDLEKGLLVVVEVEGQYAGIMVDDLLAQQQVVIKSLETNFVPVEGVSGATILGDGTVAMILDIPGLVAYARQAGIGSDEAELNRAA